MNETHSHVIVVCPKCSASQKVDINHLGQQVHCDQCNHAFQARGANGAAAKTPGEHLAGAASQTPDRPDRISIVCPGCHATLKVRRAYIGIQVRCNHCAQAFQVTDPAQPRPKPPAGEPEVISVMTLPPRGDGHDRQATKAEHQLRAQHDRLKAENERLQVEYNLLEANHDRIKAENERLTEDVQRAAADLDTFRAGLGSISPQEVQPLVEERQSLRAEVSRVRDEMETLRQTLEHAQQFHRGEDLIADTNGTADHAGRSQSENGNSLTARPRQKRILRPHVPKPKTWRGASRSWNV